MHIAILGAGISGLTAAHYLKKRYGSHLSIDVIEKSHRSGGWIQSIEEGPFFFELGPRSIRPGRHAQIIFELLRELELTPEITLPELSAKERYLFDRGRLRKIPSSPLTLLKVPYFWPFLPSLLLEWTKKVPKDSIDETVFSFFQRRVGKRVASVLVDALVNGIYAGDVDTLSMQAAFPDFYQMEKQYGSLTKAFIALSKNQVTETATCFEKAPFFTFKKGLKTLVKRLEDELSPIFFNETILKIESGSANVVVTTDRRKTTYDLVISTLPTTALGPLLTPSFFQETLPSVPMTTVATVQVGFLSPLSLPSGFGCLVPKRSDRKVLGIVWDSEVFPNSSNTTRMTVMIGGQRFKEVGHLQKEELHQVAKEAIYGMLQIKQSPDFIHSHIAKEAIPHYPVGHLANMQKFYAMQKTLFPRLLFGGSAFSGVSLSDCIAFSRRLTDSISFW